MSITYTWNIADCERILESGMITSVHYTVLAEDGEETSASVYGSVNLDAAEAGTMIPYQDVTESIALGWVQDALGGESAVTELQQGLDNQLSEQKTPTTAVGNPW
mgnify:CR=1 FL=1